MLCRLSAQLQCVLANGPPGSSPKVALSLENFPGPGGGGSQIGSSRKDSSVRANSTPTYLFIFSAIDTGP